MHRNNYSLEVLVNGRPMTEFYKDAKGFVEAREGSEYTLRFRNNSWKRVLAVFSVDGIEVIKGKVGVQADNGYVVGAYSNIEIKGYRISDQEVAAFKFGSHNKSYAVTVGGTSVDPVTHTETQIKTDKNNGVIGVRVFEEDVPDIDYSTPIKSHTYGPNVYASHTAGGLNGYCGSTVTFNTAGSIQLCSGGDVPSAATPTAGVAASNLLPFRSCDEHDVVNLYSVDATGHGGTVCCDFDAGDGYKISAKISKRADVSQFGKLERLDSVAVAPAFDLGTTWGQKLEDKVKTVAFKAVAVAVDLVIYYASRHSLEEFGIDFGRTKQIFAWPSAFGEEKTFCKVPPGYQG